MKKYLIMFFVAAAAVFQSCNNNDDLWDAIDDLKSRVQALETQVDALNGNIEAIQALANNGTISSVTEENGKCIITMTNGKVLTLVNDISAQMPVVSINKEGYWQYTIGDDTYPLEVKAVAEDGVTPQFQVNEETGNWQVKTTGDWVDVTYETGEPVKAVMDELTNDKFFESVKVNGDNLEIVLKGSDSALSIPIVKDFLCQIVDSEGTPIEGVQTFPAGVEKSYQVNMRGVVSTIVSAPEGWTAILSDPSEGENGLQTATLTVTSPEASGASAATRATASTAKDVSILASSGQFSCIAKIQVESTGQAPVPPTAQVAFTEATTESLTFTVTLSEDTESWKYICRASTEEAPSVEDFETLGTVGTDLIVTIPDLAGKTAYKLYVVAYANGLNSTVAEAEGTTKDPDADPNDYYTNGVEVNGVYYDQNSEGVVTPLELTADAQADLIVSMPGSKTVTFIGKNESSYDFFTKKDGGATITKDRIIIGRYANDRPTLKIGNFIPLRNVGGTVAFKNLIIDGRESALTNKLFDISSNDTQTGGLGTLIFEDCEIIFSQSAFLTLYNAGASSINHIIFRRCKIAYTGPTVDKTTYYLIQATQTNLTGQDGFQSIVFEDNVIYKTEESLGTHVLFHGYAANNESPVNDFTNLAFTFTRNTVVNFLPNSGQNALIVANSCASYTDISNNIYYSSPSFSRSFSNLFAIRMMAGNPDSSQIGTVQPNIAYGDFGGKLFNNYYGGTSLTMFDESPFSSMDFATGTFIKTAAAAEYGSSLDNE